MKISKKIILGVSAVLLAGVVIMWGSHRNHEKADCHEPMQGSTMMEKPMMEKAAMDKPMMDCTSCEMHEQMHGAKHAESAPTNESATDAISGTEHNH